jgi:tRNA modification GTPase
VSPRSEPALTGDTIFALSSGQPPAGIAVVRISGPGAGAALIALAGRCPAPRRATLGWLRNPHDGAVLDQGLVLWFPGPATATGEDLAELHLHGGRSVVGAVLGVLGEQAGLRLAAPGEFTRRAFENGRIDLAEAEGLADLLAAETEAQRRNALALASGALSRAVEVWRRDLLAASARIEAILDFSDEDDVPDFDAAILGAAEGIAAEIEAALARPSSERLRDGVRIVLAGPPNAGKSTLLNRLAGRDAAITAPTAGTTRDLIEAPVAIGGIAFLLIDTAGLRDGDDAIERIGIDRARGALDGADIILWLGDATHCPDPHRAIIVHAQVDLDGRRSAPADADVAISALTGEGIEALTQLITSRAATLVPGEGEVAFNRRQRTALAECAAALRMIEQGGSDLVLAAEALRLARAALDSVTGRAGIEDMLDALFGQFCIGK